MSLRPAFAALLLVLAACGGREPSEGEAPAEESRSGAASAAAAAAEPLPDKVRVRLETGMGPIVLELDAKRAPVTTGNFVRYVREKRFDGTTFYRAARTKGQEGRGFIQGGIRRNPRRLLPPIPHEPTSKTGIRHEAGTISMARAEEGAGAMGDFFITLGPHREMDSRDGKPGYAAFGRVTEGMDVARRILASPVGADSGRGAMRGQMLAEPVAIVSAREVK